MVLRSQSPEDFIVALNIRFSRHSGRDGRLAYDLGNAYLGEGSWLEDDNYLPTTARCCSYGCLPQATRLSAATTARLRGTREYIWRWRTLDQSRMQRADTELIKAEFANNAHGFVRV